MTGRVRLSPVEQGLVRGPVGPGDGQSHPLSRAGFADEQLLMNGTASLERDHETLGRQRVPRQPPGNLFVEAAGHLGPELLVCV